MNDYQFIYEDEQDKTKLRGIVLKPQFVQGNTIQLESTVTEIGDGQGPLTITPEKKFVIDASGIQSGATIQSNAFKEQYITKIIFHDSKLLTIRENAFQESHLTEFKLQNNITYGSNICKQCMDLSTIQFGDGVTTIPEYAFYGCDSLGVIQIPSTVTTIGQYAFYETDFDEFSISDDGTQSLAIKVAAFSRSFIRQLTIPKRTIMLEDDAFYGVRGFNNLDIPVFTEQCTFRNNVFANCPSLQTVQINSGVHNGTVENATGKSAFKDCKLLRQVVIGGNIEHISQNTFEGCILLKQLSLASTSSSLKLHDECFKGCVSLDYVHLPEYVNELGPNVFNGCTSLIQIILEAKTLNIDTASAFSGCTALDEVILGPKFESMSTGPTSEPEFKLYMYKQDYATNLQNQYPKYQGHIIVKPFYDRKFVNHKSIYNNQHYVDYVMYTLPSTQNKFNDCTFYFREASTTTSVVVITASQDGVMSNCVKMFQAAGDIEGKTIQKIYKSGDDLWYGKSTNGMPVLVDHITQDYVLQNNFVCEDVYDGQTEFTLDGSYLTTCDMKDLSNLTRNGKVNIDNIKRVKLTSITASDDILIKIYSLGTPVFEVQDIDTPSFKLEGDNCILYVENTIKNRQVKWSIQAAKIIIHNLWIDYTVFQGQKEDSTMLQKIECTDDLLIKFTANKTINFQLIMNKNDLIIDPDTTAINSVYYSSGWSGM